ncbi:hypothetical protein BaRGS_00021415 [Batillaria attramentaria]|uniref:Major facilitator superfamily (MFS) profile domain-containing protein n=1 Tax=Batillaria attramentaria TaxID=370345 RepID=A0ABD0KK00_9CAEN
MKFDDVLREIGEFGLYQKRLMFLFCVTSCCVITQSVSPVFTIKIPKHRCKIPTYPNDTYELQSADHASLVNETIPLRNGEYTKCTLYDVMESDGTENRTERACNEWVFDKSVFTATLVTELNLVCERKIYRSHSSMMLFAGKFVGAFLNSMGGDYFGRRRVYTFMMLALIASSIGIIFVSNLPALMAFRFMAGAFTTGSYLGIFVITTELLGTRYRRYASIASKSAITVSMLTLTLLAYLLRNWQHFQASLTTPTIFLFIGYFFIPESPRWLVSKGRYEEAQKVLELVARVNGKSLPPSFQIEALASIDSASAASGAEGKQSVSPLSLFRIPRLFLRYTLLYFCWTLIVMTLYGLLLNVSNMSGNIFLNFGIMSTLDVVSITLFALLIERVGRRSFVIGAVGVGGLACLATILPAVLGGNDWVTQGLSLSGRMFVSATMAAMYTMSPELFPTVLRSFGLGSCSMMSRIGGIASPYIADLNTYVMGTFGAVLPQMVFGAAGLLTAIMMFFLPETRGRPLPETVRDAELFGRGNRLMHKANRPQPADVVEMTLLHPKASDNPKLKQSALVGCI